MCAGLCQLCPCLQPLPIAMHVLNCVLTAACLCPRMWGNASQTLCPVCVCVCLPLASDKRWLLLVYLQAW